MQVVDFLPFDWLAATRHTANQVPARKEETTRAGKKGGMKKRDGSHRVRNLSCKRIQSIPIHRNQPCKRVVQSNESFTVHRNQPCKRVVQSNESFPVHRNQPCKRVVQYVQVELQRSRKVKSATQRGVTL